MKFVIELYLHRDRQALNRYYYYHSSANAANIRKYHTKACERIGFKSFRDYYRQDMRGEDIFLSTKIAEVLFTLPEISLYFDKKSSFEYELCDGHWGNIYMLVAKHGASIYAHRLQFEEVEPEKIML